MSNHTARSHEAAPSRQGQLIFMWAFPALVIAFVVAVTALAYHRFGVDRSWPGFPARILESRINVDQPLEGGYRGGVIQYRAEVHVRWNENGAAHDQWMSTMLTSTDRSYLQIQLTQQKVCIVRRNPHDPGVLVADLGDDLQPVHSTSAKNEQ